MSSEQVEQRLAHALLRLAKQAGRKTDAGIEIDFPISRQDVAGMTGTTLHTVSRILSAWEQQALVEGGPPMVGVNSHNAGPTLPGAAGVREWPIVCRPIGNGSLPRPKLQRTMSLP